MSTSTEPDVSVESLQHELTVERQYVADMERAYQERQLVEDAKKIEQLQRTIAYAAESIGTMAFNSHAESMAGLLEDVAELVGRIAEMPGRKGLAQAKRDAKDAQERLLGTAKRIASISVARNALPAAVQSMLALPPKP